MKKKIKRYVYNAWCRKAHIPNPKTLSECETLQFGSKKWFRDDLKVKITVQWNEVK